MSIRIVCYSGIQLVSTYKVIDVLFPLQQDHVRGRLRDTGSSRNRFSLGTMGILLSTTASMTEQRQVSDGMTFK